MLELSSTLAQLDQETECQQQSVHAPFQVMIIPCPSPALDSLLLPATGASNNSPDEPARWGGPPLVVGGGIIVRMGSMADECERCIYHGKSADSSAAVATDGSTISAGSD